MSHTVEDFLGKTLNELENTSPPAPDDPAPTRMVKRCRELRQVPLSELEPPDLRLLLGQQISPRWLVPLACELLEEDPLLDAEYYPGDLLLNVVSLPTRFWRDASTLRERVLDIARRAIGDSEGRDRVGLEDILNELERLLKELEALD